MKGSLNDNHCAQHGRHSLHQKYVDFPVSLIGNSESLLKQNLFFTYC